MKKITESNGVASFTAKVEAVWSTLDIINRLSDKGYLDLDADTCIVADDIEPQDVIDFLESEGFEGYTEESLNELFQEAETIINKL